MGEPSNEPLNEPLEEPRALKYSFWAGALLLKGSVTPRVMPDVLKFGLIAATIMVVANVVEVVWKVNLAIPHGPFASAGAVLGLLLVLRTNAGYDRWWEARKLWGGIVNQSRNLGITALAYGSSDAEWRSKFILWAAALPHVIRCSLRDERHLPEVAKLVGHSEALRIAKAKHMPSVVARALADLLKQSADAGMKDAAFLQAEQQRGMLIDYIGGCERIRNTPLARSSAIQIRQFILMFLVSLPLALLADFNQKHALASLTGIPINDALVFVPLFIMLLAYPLLSLDRIGMELQNPFDTRRLDHLPLDALCHTIEKNLMELLRDDPVASEEGPILETLEISPELAARIAKATSRDTIIS
jgi:ion channel-forming bestrophin family protein